MALFAVGCQTESAREVGGVLLEVQGADLIKADAIVLRDDGGRVYAFRVGPEVAQDPVHSATASHLRQEMTAVQRMVVRYHQSGDELVATQVRHSGGP